MPPEPGLPFTAKSRNLLLDVDRVYFRVRLGPDEQQRSGLPLPVYLISPSFKTSDATQHAATITRPEPKRRTKSFVDFPGAASPLPDSDVGMLVSVIEMPDGFSLSATMVDWTDEYDGSVGKLQAAAAYGECVLPPSGVYVRSKRVSLEKGRSTFFKITSQYGDDAPRRPDPALTTGLGSDVFVASCWNRFVRGQMSHHECLHLLEQPRLGHDGATQETQVEDPAAAVASWTLQMDKYREAMQAAVGDFYDKYNPDNKANIPAVMFKYRGKEEKMFTSLNTKYGARPEFELDPLVWVHQNIYGKSLEQARKASRPTIDPTAELPIINGISTPVKTPEDAADAKANQESEQAKKEAEEAKRKDEEMERRKVEAVALIAAAKDAAEKDQLSLQQKHKQEANAVAAKLADAERRKSEIMAEAHDEGTSSPTKAVPMQKPVLLSSKVLSDVLLTLQRAASTRAAANTATQAATAAASKLAQRKTQLATIDAKLTTVKAQVDKQTADAGATATAKVGDRVMVKQKTGPEEPGTVRYVGTAPFLASYTGTWMGIEMDTPKPKGNNGTVLKKKYFTCKDKHGVFCLPQSCRILPPEVELEVGCEVRILRGDSKGLLGIVRFMGTTDFYKGIWIGVELDCDRGKNNGTVKGKSYFTCPENRGLFVQKVQVKPTRPALKVGVQVEVTRKEGSVEGQVHFFGETHFHPGKWIGVVLPTRSGKNNGSVGGKSYFQCPDKHGLFVTEAQVKTLPPTAPSKSIVNSQADSKATKLLAALKKARAQISQAIRKGAEVVAKTKQVAEDAESALAASTQALQPQPGTTTTPESVAQLDLTKLQFGSEAEAPAEGVRVGVIMKKAEELRLGTVRFCGPVSFSKGLWIGVELDGPLGKIDGSILGKRYFTCPAQHGHFSNLKNIVRLPAPILKADATWRRNQQEVRTLATPRHL